jgi:hypothetical protein
MKTDLRRREIVAEAAAQSAIMSVMYSNNINLLIIKLTPISMGILILSRQQ